MKTTSVMAFPQILSEQHPEYSPGTITIEGDKIAWHSADVVFATFNLSDIVVIGENTNPYGPWFDNWFITFVTKDGRWFNILWYANNIDELTKILCDKFQPDLNISYLTNSKKWASIIRHPARLKDQPLFLLTPSKDYKEPKTFFDKILSSLGLGNFDTIKAIDLTDEVKNELP